jgi:hypothetical protein
MDMLWYAAYGPNVNRDRLLELIHGGKSRFNGQVYPGCRNKRDPIRDYAMVIRHEMYFARNSDAWGGALAFVRPEESKVQTLGRAYLISADQLTDLMCQENGRRPGDPDFAMNYTFAEGVKESYFNRSDPSRPLGQGKLGYGRLVRLGTRESWPIFTVTAEWTGYGEVNAPGRMYLKVISDGIRQLGKISPAALIEYYSGKVGIKERISRPVLERWMLH